MIIIIMIITNCYYRYNYKYNLKSVLKEDRPEGC